MSSVSVYLTEIERDSITQLRRRTKSLVESNRCRIILLLSEGHSVREVQERVGCVRSTVYTTLYRFEESRLAGLCDARRERRPLKATREVRDALLSYLDGPPKAYGWQRSTWTRELLALQLAKDRQVKLSVSCLGQVLREEKVRRGRPRPALRIPVKGRANRIREIEAIVQRASPDDEVFYVDEADVDLNPRIGTTYIKQGTQPLVLTPGKNVKYYIAGALNSRTGKVVYSHGPKKDSGLFVALLSELHRSYRGTKRIHLVLDNYIIHKSRLTNEALAKYNGKLVLHFLPPYSPEHNVIERLWKQMHDNVTRNHQHKTMQDLWYDVTRFLKEVQPFPGTQVSKNRLVA